MKNIFDFTMKELENFIEPKFRAKQIYEWIYKKNVDDFTQMLNLPKEIRQSLAQNFYLDPLECVRSETSSDGSIKYLFALKDGKTIESVLLPMKDELRDENEKIIRHARYSICVSSQVGCKIGCTFCLTAKGGFVRNLTPGEIVAQIWLIKKMNAIPYERRVNVVYMGMGEPLNNLDNVAKAVRILKENDGLAIAPRRQTISTSGLSTQIKKLGEMDLGVLLAISLHAVDDELREKLMPINRAYNIASIMQAVREFPIDLRKRVMFEYLIIDGINDRSSDAKTLVKLLHGIRAKVNLIYFNPHEGSSFGRPSPENMVKFQDYLCAHGITCTIRQSKGLDISAACGQLKQRNEQGKIPAQSAISADKISNKQRRNSAIIFRP
ncbi:23S rRNA (adenine(2503)-C(2))-methyltransferase RlmN [uncultured Campylobacter sp.]|uniref:23S rRNA (adenine(2503)-C(2))-methyltransferase RlmN n=2 Tax=uncultured Campylobacter sp. TaxID=218934 RepID=UPI002624137C|nr:23S rRNA (adenine(2503)-C(2))-methyltransferase RlmN [uncultured Campylobacter sp.]